VQNNNSKFKTDVKRRACFFAFDIITFIDTLPKRDWSVEIIAKQLLRRKQNFKF